MWALAKVRQISERTMQLRLRRSRDRFLQQTDWLPLPSGHGPLLVIVDGLIFKWRGKHYTCYLMLLRRPDESEATIAPFKLILGKETQPGWQEALDSLPTSIKARIRVVVCDGHLGPVNWAKQHHRLIQRCHFHLLAAIQGRRSRWWKSRHQAEGKRIYNLVENCLNVPDEKEAEKLLYSIDDESLTTSSPQLKHILRGFVHCYQDYRTYLYHPAFGLPTTTNAVESLNSCIKGLQYRTRGFATLNSFQKWLTALLKFKKRVTCRSKNQPN